MMVLTQQKKTKKNLPGLITAVDVCVYTPINPDHSQVGALS
jgi:hypothetical protein